MVRPSGAELIIDPADDDGDEWTSGMAIQMRDLLDEMGHDDDLPEYRRNQARQQVKDFDEGNW